MPSDLICVYRALDIGEADIVVAWLVEHGIEAQVKNPFTAAMFQTPFLTAPRGIEVCVLDPAEADEAIDLLQAHHDEIHQERESHATGSTVLASCEECGRDAEFPAAQNGTVQTCPHCGKYIDVPDATEG